MKFAKLFALLFVCGLTLNVVNACESCGSDHDTPETELQETPDIEQAE